MGFQCQICEKSFTLKRSLTRHISTMHKESNTTRVHEGKKDFRCQICEKSFTLKASLNRHIRTVHEGIKDFDCHFCEKAYTDRRSLKRHVATVHEGKSVSIKETLPDHEEIN